MYVLMAGSAASYAGNFAAIVESLPRLVPSTWITHTDAGVRVAPDCNRGRSCSDSGIWYYPASAALFIVVLALWLYPRMHASYIRTFLSM
jgi:hypothetical protein